MDNKINRKTCELMSILKNDTNNMQDLDKIIETELPEQDSMAFHKYYTAYLNEHNLERADIQRISRIKKATFYDIVNGKKTPNRDKVLALAIASGMDLTQVNRCLKLAGKNELYPKNERDFIIIYALNQKCNLEQVEELLFEKTGQAFIVSKEDMENDPVVQ